jgi:hypothetical protein
MTCPIVRTLGVACVMKRGINHRAHRRARRCGRDEVGVPAALQSALLKARDAAPRSHGAAQVNPEAKAFGGWCSRHPGGRVEHGCMHAVPVALRVHCVLGVARGGRMSP